MVILLDQNVKQSQQLVAFHGDHIHVSFLKSCYTATHHVLLGLSTVNACGQVTKNIYIKQTLLFDVREINITLSLNYNNNYV